MLLRGFLDALVLVESCLSAWPFMWPLALPLRPPFSVPLDVAFLGFFALPFVWAAMVVLSVGVARQQQLACLLSIGGAAWALGAAATGKRQWIYSGYAFVYKQYSWVLFTGLACDGDSRC